jgi:NAD(P)-dependent dehydrogenase (short-subunit alcohol dehydrogenase family)
MTQLINKIALVTGGSRGLGRGIVEALTAEGAQVWTMARDANQLDRLKQEIGGVQTWVADVADPRIASQALREIRPDILVLNAGAAPHMAPIHEQSWEQFGRVWETDVKATFTFGKEALLMPLASGSVVVIVSSGAAIGGSPLSGGYAGAKRMQWFLAQYLQQESDTLNLGLRFVALLPKQIVGTTALGQVAASAYAAQQGISQQAFLERSGPPLTPEGVGRGVVTLLTDSAYRGGIAFGITSQGLASLN